MYQQQRSSWSTNKMYIMYISELVIGSLLLVVITYRQETCFLVTEQTTILSSSNGSFHGRWGVVNIRTLWHVKIWRVIYKTSRYRIIEIVEPSQPNGLRQIHPDFKNTCLVWGECDWLHIVWVGWDTLRSIYCKTTWLQNTVYLAPTEYSQIKGSVVWWNH